MPANPTSQQDGNIHTIIQQSSRAVPILLYHFLLFFENPKNYSKVSKNGYLLYGKRLKCEICFKRNEIVFHAEIQRKFTYLTSEACSIIEFDLNFGIIKNFIESKIFMLKTVFPYNMQLFATVSNQHCGTSLSVFTQNPAKNQAKNATMTFILAIVKPLSATQRNDFGFNKCELKSLNNVGYCGKNIFPFFK